MTPADFREMTCVRQGADSDPNDDAPIAARIAAVARAAPDTIAVEAEGKCLTYGDLLAEADALAEKLVRLGVGPNIPVGVCIERSIDQIIALFGVMCAGGAFIPLDPAWPEARISKLLNDAAAPVVVTVPAMAERLSAAGCMAVTIERKAESCAVSLLPNAAEADKEDLAYIIYTSGSTGEPKGVEITQRNLSNLIAWHIEAFNVTAKDRASCLAGLGFDACVWEIWPYLTAGACISLADETVRTSPELLRLWLIDRKITVAFVPTILAEPMLAAEWPAETRLRLLLTGGDRLHARPRPTLPFAVVNNYGPTECTVVATSGIVIPESKSSALPSIGRPIRSTRILILDGRGKHCTQGRTGEIYVGGESVGRGYRGQPQLTAERFTPDPFAKTRGARLYRTGDLGSWLPDGQIAFHGRADDQLKIRGHRVEPGEIALALNRHPWISQCVVIGRSNRSQTVLAAYIVPSAGDELRLRELRDFLAGTLPDYMIPSIFVRIPALPLTVNGKLDKSALPPPSPGNTLRDIARRAPSNAVEQRLSAIVAALLAVEHIGADDNFFYLGGHSLLGTQLVLRIRDMFGVAVTLRHLFEAPTISGLARCIEQLAIEKVAGMSDEEARALVQTEPSSGEQHAGGEFSSAYRSE